MSKKKNIELNAAEIEAKRAEIEAKKAEKQAIKEAKLAEKLAEKEAIKEAKLAERQAIKEAKLAEKEIKKAARIEARKLVNQKREFVGLDENIVEQIKNLDNGMGLEYSLDERPSGTIKILTATELSDNQLYMIKEYSNAILFDSSRRRDLLLPIHNRKVQHFAGKFLNIALKVIA